MTYASPAWEFAANTHLLKIQSLQNKVLHTIGNFQRRTPVLDLHKAFNIPYIYDHITKLCKQSGVIQYKNANVRHIGQGDARHRKHKRLNLGGGQAYYCSIV
jgi:hypothetical protein